MPRPNSKNYRDIFLNDRPICDLRAPSEFERGSFPAAVNHPLMSDAERAAVGTCYKQKGQEAAIALGHQLVSGDEKATRMQAWTDFCAHNPDGYLFCFRGGLRSKTTQQWLKEAGTDYPLIEGGYKAMRQFLLTEYDRIAGNHPAYVLGGRTGVGKTIFLQDFDGFVDLEGFAHHKGSSFGRPIGGIQPSQIDFENALTIQMMKVEAAGLPLLIEDEGKRIGQRNLSDTLWDTVCNAPLIILDQPFEARVETIYKDYVTDLMGGYLETYGDKGGAEYANYMRDSLYRIRKRLGGARYQHILGLLDSALASGKKSDHEAWISTLLMDYYDPMYDYQIDSKKDRIVFMGDWDAVHDYLNKKAGR